MGAPKINISFIEKAKTLMKRSKVGVVGLVLKDTIPSSFDSQEFTVKYKDDIPSFLSDFNKEQIELALLGNESAPKKVVCYVMDESSSADDLYEDAKVWIQQSNIDFLAIPTVETDGKLSEIITFIKNEVNVNKHNIMAILPFKATEEDSHCIVGCDFVGYTNKETHTETSGTYTAEEYCSRIAGFIAGTPLTQSITYGTLTDLTDCNRLSEAEQDAAVDAGKLVLMNDGEKVKIVRGVTTLQTLTDTKQESFKKIKIVCLTFVMQSDLKTMIRDQYIGKYNNDYDNKCNLVIAVNSYFKILIEDELIIDGTCTIDIEAIRKYLLSKGEDVVEMEDEDILKAKTGSYVFLTGNVQIPDAMEDVEFPIYL